MLIDEVIAHASFARLVEAFPRADGITSAHAFFMTDDAKLAGAHLAQTSKTAAPIIEQFRLPYPLCWIETTIDRGKVGWYIDGRTQSSTRQVFVMRVMRDDRGGCIEAAGVFEPDTLELIFDADGRRGFTLECEPSKLMADTVPDADRLLGHTAINVMSLIAIINSPAISSSEPSELRKINKKRARDGKPPLRDYSTIRIRPEIARQIKGAASAEESSGGKKLHWRRGHFKSLSKKKSGLFWWKPCLAGRAENGVTKKDYVV